MTLGNRSERSRFREPPATSARAADPKKPPVLPFYVVIDESASMSSQVDFLNASITHLFASLMNDRELVDKVLISVIAFSDEASTLLPLSRLDEIDSLPGIRVGGGSVYGLAFNHVKAAIDDAVTLLKARHARVLRPIVIFISDGSPQDEPSWRLEHHLLTTSTNPYRPHIVAFGVEHSNESVILDVATDIDGEGNRFAWSFDETPSGRPDLFRAILPFLTADIVADQSGDTSDSTAKGDVNAPDAVWDTFISHSDRDRHYAEQLTQELESAGCQVAVAFRDVPPGADYGAWIFDAIRRSASFTLLLSPDSTASRHCLRELELALQQEQPRIVPAWIAEHELPAGFQYRLASCQFIPFDRAAEAVERFRQ